MEENKKLFVEKLGSLLRRCGYNKLDRLEYVIENSQEYIVIHWRGEVYTDKISIGGDSLPAVMRDITNALM